MRREKNLVQSARGLAKIGMKLCHYLILSKQNVCVQMLNRMEKFGF